MSGGHEQISKNPNFKRLVPMDESRAELTELGTSEEEQDKRLGREAAEKVLGEVAVGESKNTVCNTESAKRLFEKYYRLTVEACIGQIL